MFIIQILILKSDQGRYDAIGQSCPCRRRLLFGGSLANVVLNRTNRNLMMRTLPMHSRCLLAQRRVYSPHSAISTAPRKQCHSKRLPSIGRVLHVVKARLGDEEPDWEKEMSIFKQRTMRPNQLATLRQLESKVNLGRVSTTAAKTFVELQQGFGVHQPHACELQLPAQRSNQHCSLVASWQSSSSCILKSWRAPVDTHTCWVIG